MTNAPFCPECGPTCPLHGSDPDRNELDRLRTENADLTQELATVRDTLRHRSNALNATGTHNDQLRAQLAGVSRIVGVLATEVELECDPEDGVCHGHDLLDDGRCALLSDLERARAIIRGDAK